VRPANVNVKRCTESNNHYSEMDKNDSARVTERIVELALVEMNESNEREFIKNSLLQVHPLYKFILEYRLVAIKGSDKLIREYRSGYTFMCVLLAALHHSEERARHLSRLPDGGDSLYDLALSFMGHCHTNYSDCTIRLLLRIIKEERDVDTTRVHNELSRSNNSIKELLMRLYNEEV